MIRHREHRIERPLLPGLTHLQPRQRGRREDRGGNLPVVRPHGRREQRDQLGDGVPAELAPGNVRRGIGNGERVVACLALELVATHRTVAEIVFRHFVILHQVVPGPESPRQDHVRMADVVEVHGVHATSLRDFLHDGAEIVAHLRATRAEPLVVANVRWLRERGVAIAADVEPFGVVGLDPGVATPIEDPRPRVNAESLGVRRLGDHRRVATANQHTGDSARAKTRETAAPGRRVVGVVAMDPCPGTKTLTTDGSVEVRDDGATRRTGAEDLEECPASHDRLRLLTCATPRRTARSPTSPARACSPRPAGSIPNCAREAASLPRPFA